MINNVNEMFEMYKIKGPVCVLASLFQDRNRIVKTIVVGTLCIIRSIYMGHGMKLISHPQGAGAAAY